MITVIGNMKGGTGKSTVSFNLAVWLAQHNQSVRVFDCDPQKTMSDVLQVRIEEGYAPALAPAEDADDLSHLSRKDSPNNQHLLIDASMSDKNSLSQAILLADQILIPVAPSQADIWSTQRFLNLILSLRPKPPRLVAVLNRADTHPFVAETKETEEALDRLNAIERVPFRLHNRTSYRRSFSEGLAVFELEPNGKASWEFLQMAKALFGESLNQHTPRG